MKSKGSGSKSAIILALGGLLFSLAVASSSLPQLAAQQAEIATATVTVESKTVKPGATTTIKVFVDGIPASGLSDFQGKLTYDPGVVIVEDVKGASGYTLFAFKIDNDKGEVRFVAAKISGELIRSGEILEFAVRAIGARGAESVLDLTLETFNDPEGNDIPRVVNDGTFSIVVPKPPKAEFTFAPESPEVGEEVQFTDQSRDPDGEIVSWLWDFGDGTTSTEQNPKHKYAAKGKYTVKLTVTDSDGLTATVSKTVPVGFKPPTANFTFAPAAPKAGQLVQFTDRSSDPDGEIVSWLWDFGDGTTSTEQNPKHAYAEEGTYTIKLTVTDDDGLTATAIKEITVEPGKPTVTVHCYPNPASTQTTFKYALPKGTAKATLYVFDVTGRLVFHHDLPTTAREYTWDLKSDVGEELPSGPYFYYIVAFDRAGKLIARSKLGKLVIQRS